MFRRRAQGSGLLLSLALVSLAGCAPGPSPGSTESMASFALTSADIAVPEGQDFDVTLPFLADPSDPIWTQLVMAGIPKGAYAEAASIGLERKEGLAGKQLGSLTLRIPRDAFPLSFTTLEMQFEGEDDLRSVDVGQWNLVVGSPNPKIPEVGRTSISGAIPCGPTSGTFRNDSGEIITFSSAAGNAPGVQVTTRIEPSRVSPRENFELTLDLSCDTSSDFYMVSPDVVFETEGTPVSTRLGWLSVGFTDIDDAKLEHINQR